MPQLGKALSHHTRDINMNSKNQSVHKSMNDTSTMNKDKIRHVNSHIDIGIVEQSDG